MRSRLALLPPALAILAARRLGAGLGTRCSGPEQGLKEGLEDQLDLARVDPLTRGSGLVFQPLELLFEPIRSTLVLVTFAGDALTLVGESVALGRRRREVLFKLREVLRRCCCRSS
jgi:hypothetical protein